MTLINCSLPSLFQSNLTRTENRDQRSEIRKQEAESRKQEADYADCCCCCRCDVTKNQHSGHRRETRICMLVEDSVVVTD